MKNEWKKFQCQYEYCYVFSNKQLWKDLKVNNNYFASKFFNGGDFTTPPPFIQIIFTFPFLSVHLNHNVHTKLIEMKNVLKSWKWSSRFKAVLKNWNLRTLHTPNT